MLRVTFPVGMLGCNCTILGDEQSGEALVIDPGDEVHRITEVLTRNSLRPVAIVHTHAHIDHIGATAELAERTGAPTFLHPGDDLLYRSAPMQAMLIGLPTPKTAPISQTLDDLQGLRFGAYEVGVLHTPGHTPGSVCFEVAGHDLCFSGDTLFAQSVGRTDLPGGDYQALERSIRDRLYTLNGAVEVVPGHGPPTTIDAERTHNPFVRARR
jgi:glyoxylase-like metal-dependent hydrolase (beta-lactamase superfamily II)